ncbi:putative regulator of cell autolysis [Halobacteroides halobius DSM 5150]|uniref:histidine kinase n=1 Tax=Halobacteroides halobius (strain ATCC 35273 / DSM 5150 / MD-1) TaxID=748449 RepID=L0K9Z9_HALHC|nr:sensor histidine kinase [Halobacteroides halobius]AGB41345.1 putative regulator of cell autolysis [Halobacteroides halobius DSM 5150]
MADNLLFSLVKSISVIGISAYLLALEANFFQKLIIDSKDQTKIKNQFLLAILFGFLSLLGTYLGIYTHGAYANIRAVGAVIGGLLGGPIVGVIAGLIGGLHRYYLGGFTALACALATTLAGLISGAIYKDRSLRKISLKEGFLLGVGLEILEMALVLILSNPYARAYELVKIISVPMILSNALGVAFFIYILHKDLEKKEKVKALQAYKALEIANQSLAYLQEGLNYESARETAKIILQVTDLSAVAITNRKEVLAHCGKEQYHHRPQEEIITQATKEALNQGQLKIISTKEEIGCPVDECTLKGAVIAPLTKGVEKKVIGTLKLYKTEEGSINGLDIELAWGIANLLSTQLHLSSLKQQAKLATEAELKALQAQVRPHFLFNSLNTISSFCRTDPKRARELIMKLAKFLRKTLNQSCQMISLAQELEFVHYYIDIEEARFEEKLKVELEISEDLTDYQLPSFILQPLVENAIKHGISPKVGPGQVKILAKKEEDLLLQVIDDGVGIKEDPGNLLEMDSTSDQIGLSNVNQRIKKIYGTEYGLMINSKLGQGTTVTINLPQVGKEDIDE